jgi:glycine cleavage system H protein
LLHSNRASVSLSSRLLRTKVVIDKFNYMNMSPYDIQEAKRNSDYCFNYQAKKKIDMSVATYLELMNMNEDFYQEVADKFIFKVKKDLLYTESDIWVKIQDNGSLIGITDFLQKRAGDAIFVELPQEGRTVKRGDEISSLETIKAIVSVTAPLNGVVAEVNSALKAKPELINEDPYGEAWLVLVSPTHLEEDRQSLMTAEKYFELMKSKIKNDRERVATKEV